MSHAVIRFDPRVIDVILATERTDPGWVPLYPSCSGLLIERGSLLSHSAVVAREERIDALQAWAAESRELA